MRCNHLCELESHREFPHNVGKISRHAELLVRLATLLEVLVPFQLALEQRDHVIGHHARQRAVGVGLATFEVLKRHGEPAQRGRLASAHEAGRSSHPSGRIAAEAIAAVGADAAIVATRITLGGVRSKERTHRTPAPHGRAASKEARVGEQRSRRHDGIGSRLRKARVGIRLGAHVAVGDHGDRQRLFDGRNCGPIGAALVVALLPQSSMHGQRAHARLFEHFGERDGVLHSREDPDLAGDGHA
mmetsp:Transcript_84183/g.252457  ORF Transcript_84183/g.252457 Transcript_84183/m.252457 type:complete len:244 (-) Transcript_84183:136-867(-)